MISRLALIWASFFAARNIYPHEKIDIYKYGFELLISTALNFLSILIISTLMGVISGAVLFCAAFIPLRLAAGGYHAKHHWSCVLGFNIVFLIFAHLNRLMIVEFTYLYIIASAIISTLFIWSLAPVAAVNKPLKVNQRERLRKRSIVIACVNLAVAELFCLVGALRNYSAFFAFYNSGALAASLSLIAAELVTKKTAH